jgi:hypothetical protein
MLLSEHATSCIPNNPVLNSDASMLILFCILDGNYQEAAELGRLFFRQFPIEMFDFISYYMLVGVANIALFMQTGRRRHYLIIKARHYRKQIIRICRTAMDYCLSRLKILEAELSTISRRDLSQTMQKFSIAISLADSKNHVFEAAFARERYARFLLARGKYALSLMFFQSSCRLYQEWNAYRKVTFLEEEIMNLSTSISSENFVYDAENLNNASRQD